MLRAFRVFWRGITDTFEELVVLALANLLWVLIAGPLLYLSYALLLGGSGVLAAAALMLAILPLAPASIGIQSICLKISEGRAVKLGDFFAGIREHTWDSWRALFPWTLGLLILLFNLQFYASLPGILGGMLFSLFCSFVLIWFGMLVYTLPLLLRQHDKRLLTLARNALLLTVSRPLFTLLTLLLMGLVLFLSSLTVILPLLIMVAFLAQWSQRATDLLLEEERRRRELLEQQQTVSAPPAEKGRKGQVRPRE